MKCPYKPSEKLRFPRRNHQSIPFPREYLSPRTQFAFPRPRQRTRPDKRIRSREFLVFGQRRLVIRWNSLRALFRTSRRHNDTSWGSAAVGNYHVRGPLSPTLPPPTNPSNNNRLPSRCDEGKKGLVLTMLFELVGLLADHDWTRPMLLGVKRGDSPCELHSCQKALSMKTSYGYFPVINEDGFEEISEFF